MTSVNCGEEDLEIIRDILGNRSEQILSEEITRIDKETFRKLFLNHSEQGIISDDLISDFFSASNKSLNCSNPYILRMGDSRPLSEEVISWVLATLPMGAMVRIIKMTLQCTVTKASSVSDWKPLVGCSLKTPGQEADHHHLRSPLPGLVPLYWPLQPGPELYDAPGVQGHVRLCRGHRCPLCQVM